MDELFIQAAPSFKLRPPSLTSLCTQLDSINPYPLPETTAIPTPPIISFERHIITLDQMIHQYNASTSSSQESLGDHRLESSPATLPDSKDTPQSSAPSTNEHSLPDAMLQPASSEEVCLGAETVWSSELDIYFSESDNEVVVEEDRDSKEYFKVEDLGPCMDSSGGGGRRCEKVVKEGPLEAEVGEGGVKTEEGPERAGVGEIDDWTIRKHLDKMARDDSAVSDISPAGKCVSGQKLPRDLSLCLNPNTPALDDSGFDG